jgi:hypothetical protein
VTAPSFPIFSPTDTEKYLQCPRLRVLNKTWTPRTEVWQPWRDIGVAIHAGLAQAFAPNIDAGSPLEVALWSLLTTLPSPLAGDWTMESLNALTRKGLEKAIAVNCLDDGDRAIGTELRPEGYHAVLDLLHETAQGDLVVTDHKVKRKGEKGKLSFIERDFDPAWQTWHYAWTVWREYGRVPKIQYLLIFLTPNVWAKVFVPDTQPTEEGLAVWERDARYIWEEMAKTPLGGLQLPPGNPRGCHPFGPKTCDFYDFCWEGLNGRSHVIDLKYVRKEPNEDPGPTVD